ncbi:copper resistance protein CopC [Blastococcus colisei]|nr:copper resistance protein CopC [Blastococcus colisei]
MLVASVVGGLSADIVTAPPAAAHATLVATTPGESARLAAAPREVTLQFSEGVSLGAGFVRVLSVEGRRLDADAATVDGAVITVPMRDDVPEGSYVVTYRVVSADAHPISGGYAFVVGDGELVSAVEAAAGQDTDPLVAALLPLARWLGFTGVALAIGVPVFLLVCWPSGWAVPRMQRLTSVGLTGIVVGGAATFLLQGPYTAGTGLGSVFDPLLLEATAASLFGVAVIARVVVAVMLAMLLQLAWDWGEAPSAPVVASFAFMASEVVATTAAAGHPAAGPLPGLAVAVAAVHVAAMAVWLGGLIALLVGVLRTGAAVHDLHSVLPRFSVLAFGAVVALALTGLVQAVREVGALSALVSTTYGRLLMAKLVVVLCLLGVAGVSRAWVQRHLGTARRRPPSRRVTAHAFAAVGGEAVGDEVPDPQVDVPATAGVDDIRSLCGSVLLEVAIGAVVLVASAFLVGTPPARSALSQAVDVTVPLQSDAGATTGSVRISVAPAEPGQNALDVYLFDEVGGLVQPRGIRVTLTEAEQEVGPLDVELVRRGPGHLAGSGFSIPGPGTWALTVIVRLDEFTAASASTDIRVR